MSLELPPELRSVAQYLVGVWPSADEDGLRSLAGVYEGAAREARGLAEALAWQSSHVPGWEGQAQDAHDAMVERVLHSSGLADFVQAAERIADGAWETAAQVEKAKYQAIIILVWLVETIAWALAMAPWTGGASMAAVAAAEAATQQLLRQVGQWLLRAVIAAGTGAAFMMAADGLSQGIVIAKGHSDHFDVKSFLAGAGMGALAGLAGLGTGAAVAKLVSPSLAYGLPGQLVQQAGISAGMDVGFRAVQGAPVTDTGAALAQGAFGAFGGRYGAHVRVGGAPKGLAEALARLEAARDGHDAASFGPFEAVPDSGQGFDLPGGQWLEVTAGGTWWARPQGADTQPAQAAFTSAVRSMGTGSGGRARLVVGLPGTSPVGVAERLATMWDALRREAPGGPAGLPREIILAEPVGTGELAGLQEFAAAHRVGVSVPNGQVLVKADSTPSAVRGGSATESRAERWLHITPAAEAGSHPAIAGADRSTTVPTAAVSAKTPATGPLVGSKTSAQQTVASDSALGRSNTAVTDPSDAVAGSSVSASSNPGTTRSSAGSAPLTASRNLHNPHTSPPGTDSTPPTTTLRSDAEALTPTRESAGSQGSIERRWEQENRQWQRILDDDAGSRTAPEPGKQREGFPASREEAWTNYRSALARQEKAQHSLEVQSQRPEGAAGASHFSPERAVADARHVLNQAQQQTRNAQEDLRAWGNDPKRLENLHHEWQQQSLRNHPRLQGGWGSGWDPFNPSHIPDHEAQSERNEFFNFMGQLSSGPTSARESTSPEPESTDHDSGEWTDIRSFAEAHGVSYRTMATWTSNSEWLTSRSGQQHWGRPPREYRISDLDALLQEHADTYRPRAYHHRSPNHHQDLDTDAANVLQVVRSGSIRPTNREIREFLNSERSYATQVKNRVEELLQESPQVQNHDTYEQGYNYGGGHYGNHYGGGFQGWNWSGAPRSTQMVGAAVKHSQGEADWPSGREVFADVQEWIHRRSKAPVTRIETERFEPATGAIPSQGRIPGSVTRIRHDIRRIQLPAGPWVREFTVRLQLRPGPGVSADQVHGVQNRATDIFDRHINQRYRFANGDQFHVRLEFDTPSPHARVVVHHGADSDQVNWSTAAPDGVLVHEVMHFLGLRDRYPDENMLFRRHSHDRPGVMGTDAVNKIPALTGAHLQEIEDVTTATGVLRDLPTRPRNSLTGGSPTGATSVDRPMPRAAARIGGGLREAGGLGSATGTGRAHDISAALDPAGLAPSPPDSPRQNERPEVPRGDATGTDLPPGIGPAARRDVTSAEQVRRALGKLSEAQYEKLAAQVDRFVKTDVVIGDDAAAHRSRAANTALRDRVIHALHRTGGNENEARRLAYELGILRTRGLPGGSGYWNYPSSYSPRDDDDLLYRDDTRDPDEIFEEGFRPKSPEAEVSHYRHMMGHPETSWVSTSRRSDLRKVRGYRYEVDAPGSGLDAEHEYGSSYPFRSEREVAFDGGIDRTQILGAGEEVRPPRGLASWGADDGSDSFYLVNPHFRFPSEADEYSWPASGYEPSIPDDRYSSDDERPSSPWSSWHHQNDEDDEE